jgi:hypothetical protein
MQTFRGNGGPATILEISKELPESVELTLPQWKEFYQQEAARIEKVLHEALPGGLYDALMIEMMRNKVSLFVVPHSSFKP